MAEDACMLNGAVEDLRKVCYDLYIDCVGLLTDMADEGKPIREHVNKLQERRQRLIELGILDGGI